LSYVVATQTELAQAASRNGRSITGHRRSTGAPKEFVARLNTEGAKMLAQPEMRERLGTLIEADLERWKKLVADARLQLE